MTSSARCNSDGGIVRPRAFAVFEDLVHVGGSTLVGLNGIDPIPDEPAPITRDSIMNPANHVKTV
jgi:hypothetical protein